MANPAAARKKTPVVTRTDQKRTPALGAILRALRRELPLLRREYGVRRLGVFGSQIRGEATARSDLDVLVEFKQSPTFAKRLDLKERLESVVGIPVDLIERKQLKPYVRQRVEGEVVWISNRESVAPSRLGVSRRSNGGAMAPKREYLDAIQDMLSSMEHARRFAEGVTKRKFFEDTMRVYAVKYAVQTIGEAANRIPSDVRMRYPKIPWREIIGMRNWIAHGYDVVDDATLWNAVTVSIPRDEPFVREMLEQEKRARKAGES